MKKLFTKQFFRVFTLLTLMLTTAFVANAEFCVVGDNNGWSETNFQGCTMQQDNGLWVIDLTVTAGQQFKIYNNAQGNDIVHWWGGNNDSRVVTSIPWRVNMEEGSGDNIKINVSGIIRFTFNPSTWKLDLSYAPTPRPVVVASGIQSTVVADKTEASAGETVTLTVTPAEGFWADNTCIEAYATITPPGTKEESPNFGEQLTIVGDAIASHSEPGTYTFTMPDAPKGAYVNSVDFKACIPLDAEMFNTLPQYAWTGGPIVPTVSPTTESGLTSNDYVVSYDESIEEGNYTVTVTGKGKYTGTVTLPYSIVKVPHDIIISQEIQHGQVDARPNPAIVGKEITLTATPESGYELESYTVTPAEGDPIAVTVTDGVYTFIMPNCDVTVFATFTKIPKLYLTGSFNNWGLIDQGGSPNLEFTKKDDGSWELVLTEPWDASTSFKLEDENGTWYGANETGSGEYWITYEKIGVAQDLSTDGGAKNFLMPVAGTWTFTVNAARTKLTVTGDWYFNITTAVAVANTGTLTADKTTAKKDEKVELTVTPETGYEFASLVVTYGENQTITPTLKEGETNIYEFTMPASDVTVTATFTKIIKLYLTGSFNNWGLTEQGGTPNLEFTKKDDGSWELVLTEPWDANTSFKLEDENGTWYGANETGNGDYWITKEKLNKPETLSTDGQAKNFLMPVAGKWTFTVNAARTTLTVSGIWDYAIDIVAEGCTVTTNPADRAPAMETVTVTVTPTVENSTGVITVVDADGNPVEFNTTNSTFVMPYSDVTITATYTVQKFAITLGTSADYTLTTNQTDNSQVAVGTEVTVTVTPTNTADFVPAGLVTDPALQSTITDNGDGTYTFTMPANAINITATLNAILHGVLFDANHRWATYFGAYNLVAPTGVEVYVVGADYALGEEVPVTKINYIPENKGVLLYCPNDMSDITTPLVAEDDLESNIPATALKGSVNPMTLAAYENYVLYNDVFLLAQAGTLPAHRCYLPKPAGNSKMRLTLNRPGDGGVITAIEGIDANSVANVKYVNLSGMTSDKPFSGINIMVITRTDGSVETMKVVR